MEGQRHILDLCVDAGETLLANGAEKGLSVKKNFQAPMTKEQYLREWGHLDI